MRGAGIAIAVALAASVGAGSVARAAEPTFKNGLAQAVFTTDQSKWISYDGWVQSNSDSDHDGKLDRIHFDVTRPPETDQGLKVPTIMEASTLMPCARNSRKSSATGRPDCLAYPERVPS